MTRLGHRHQHVDALRLAAGLARHMQAMRDERVFELEDLLAEREDVRVDIARPQGRGSNQIEFGCL